ncbi:MAG: 50S ribosomal protein L11 methyltransferase [Clostridiales bacterium]|nr:50S ribosomal protein L11 methyltransferase [Clostridiales bacterium]
MNWTEIRIKTTEEAIDAVSEMLTEAGAAGVVIEDPNDIRKIIEAPGSLDYADEEFMNSLGEDVLVKAYFNCEGKEEGLVALIKEKLVFISQFLDVGEGYAGLGSVDDEDWSTAWKKYYKPFNITDRIVIKPTWEEYAPKENEMIIELDPGMAFGTGTHETTMLCSQLLEKYLEKGDKVLDAGCGSGILSIVAAKLGAEAVTAFDIDVIAVRVTKENCELNGVEKCVSAFSGTLDGAYTGVVTAGGATAGRIQTVAESELEPEAGNDEKLAEALKSLEAEKVDIVVANIIADVIVSMTGKVGKYLEDGGLFITSGIIRERKDDVVNACAADGLELVELKEAGEWVAMVFKCQNSL